MTSVARRVAISLSVSLFFPLFLFAQNVSPDSSKKIEQEILSHPDTDNEIIAKSRAMIRERLHAGDVAKTADIVSYLDERFAHRRVLALLPFERFLVAYWTRQYSDILNPSMLDTLERARYKGWLFPQEDMLFEDLRELSRDHRVSLKGAAMASSVSDADKDFLLLFLDFILTDGTYAKPDEELNRACDEYLALHRDSPYGSYVRQNIRLVIRESDWGYGFDFSLGNGTYSGALANRFSSGLCLGVGFDIARRKLIGPLDIVGYFRFAIIADSKVRNEFEFNGIWRHDLELTSMIPEFSLGVVALENSWIQIAPFAGISGILIEPPQDVRNQPGNNVSLNMVSWTAGLSADWTVGSSALPVVSSNEHGRWTIRTRISYTAPTSPPDPRFNGSVLTITVGVGLFGRPVYREM